MNERPRIKTRTGVMKEKRKLWLPVIRFFLVTCPNPWRGRKRRIELLISPGGTPGKVLWSCADHISNPLVPY